MSNRRALIACLIFLAALPAGADSPAVEEARALVKDGQFPAALQRVALALGLKGPAAEIGVSRYQLFTLKGESHLGMRQMNLAVEAYGNAAKAATAEDQRALAAAHDLLLKRAQQFAYKPRPIAGKLAAEPIDIVDPASRRRAFAALLADELAAAEPKVKAALKAKALPPIFDAIKAASALTGLELAASGDAPKARELLKGLTEQARKLLAGAVADANKRVAAIDKEANTFVEFWYDAFVPSGTTAKTRRERAWRRKGPTDAQLRELQEIAATCDKIPAAVESIAQAQASDGKELATFADDAARTRKEVGRLLDTDYQQVLHTPPKK